MKKIILFLPLLHGLLCTAIYSQDTIHVQKDFTQFEINVAKHNGKNITKSVLKERYLYKFYTFSDADSLLFTYFSDLNSSNMYGPIYSVTKATHFDPKRKERSETYHFYWSYYYSQYIDKGTAKVTLLIVHKPKGDYFELSMKYEDLEEYFFKGKVKGDLTLLDSEIGKKE